MPQLILNIDIPRSTVLIEPDSKLYFTGSCFAENIGSYLKHYKFKTCVNPFGVQYNPLAISKSIDLLLEKEEFTEKDLHFENELWFSYNHYTLFSDVDKQTCLYKINCSFSKAKKFLVESNFFIFTLGSSWAYKLRENKEIVSNCHKLPANRFERIFTDSDQTFEEMKKTVETIKNSNPSAKFIFTVSPIRHWKDGAIENQRSKSALILAIARLEKEIEGIYYFPAYEIMMDELRDYRFYKSDMLHPSEQAIEYIQERFSTTFLSDKAFTFISEIKPLLNAIEHRPVHPLTGIYKKFISSQLSLIEKLSKKYPLVNFNNEYIELKGRLE